MLLYNNHKMHPTEIAKGVDKHATDVERAQPMFHHKLNPFDNYFAIQHQDERLMGYNEQGNFAATNMQRWSHEQQFKQMAQNESIVNLVNGKRRGEF